MKNKKGISLVAISVSVVVMIILISTIAITATSSINNAKKVAFANEIYNIQSEVDEYYKNSEEALPTTGIVTVDLSNLGGNSAQFSAESDYINNNTIILDKLDLETLDISNTQYGNAESNEDVYVVSGYTNKVYYLQGVSVGSNRYYTLNDELLKIIEKGSNEEIEQGPITFTPSASNWTNEAITVEVNANSDYQISSITATNSVENIEVTAGQEYSVNTTSLVENNYTITVNYNKVGEATTLQAIYMVKKFDNQSPVINIENMTYSNGYLKNILVEDDNSGIKAIKYSEGTITADNARVYFSSNGKNIKNGKFKTGNSKNYTIYVEDRAGNAIVTPVEADKNVMSKGYSTNIASDGTYTTNSISLENSIFGNTFNYSIQGNSIQNGTPTPEAPIEVLSLGENSKNLFDYTKISSSSGIEVRNNGKEIVMPLVTSGHGSTPVGAKLSELCPKLKVGDTAIVDFTRNLGMDWNQGIYLSKSQFAWTSSSRPGIAGYRVRVITQDDLDSYVYLYGNNYTYGNETEQCIIQNFQILLATMPREYRPYGYKYIDVTSGGKNFIPELKYVNIYNNSETDNISTAVFLKQGNYKLSIGKIENCTSWRLYFKLWDKNGNRILNTTGASITTLSQYGTFETRKSDNTRVVFYINYSDDSNRQGFLMCDNTDVTENAVVNLTFRDDYYVRFYLFSGNIGTTSIVNNVQLEYGNEVTSYEPYRTQTTTIDLTGHEPLRKIGNVADYIDYANKRIVRKISKLVFDGDNVKCKEFDQYYYYSNLTGVAGGNHQVVLATHCTSEYNYGKTTPNVFISAEPQLYFVGWKTLCPTLTEFNDFLREQYDAGTPVTVYYKLSTPVYESIELPKIPVFDKFTNITIRDTVINSVGIKATYPSDVE